MHCVVFLYDEHSNSLRELQFDRLLQAPFFFTVKNHGYNLASIKRYVCLQPQLEPTQKNHQKCYYLFLVNSLWFQVPTLFPIKIPAPWFYDTKAAKKLSGRIILRLSSHGFGVFCWWTWSCLNEDDDGLEVAKILGRKWVNYLFIIC